MKNNNIIAAIAAASAILLSASCQKQELHESQNGVNEGTMTFTATIEQNLTKTTLDAHKVNWITGDVININDVTFKATADETDATKAIFAKEPATQEDPAGPFEAIYPNSLYVNGHFELPATQTYKAGEFNAPMYARSETQLLSFKNICAVLAVKVTSDDIAMLKSIKVKADKKLNGTFTVASKGDGYKAEIGTDGTNEVVLSLGEEAIEITSEMTFYIAIPEQEYSFLKIYLSEDGNIYKRAMITKKAEGLGTFACNTLYNVNYETNAVQLYADGPYWSTMNVGAQAPTESGWYFSWGNTTGYVHNGTYWVKASDNTITLVNGFSSDSYASTSGKQLNEDITTKEYDAAYANWGAGWRMPTGGNSEGEFVELVNNATSVWVGEEAKVRKFTGKDKYSDIDLFFPATGYGDANGLKDKDVAGRCWSSKNISALSAYSMSFGSTYRKMYDGKRFLGQSVRPVSD